MRRRLLQILILLFSVYSIYANNLIIDGDILFKHIPESKYIKSNSTLNSNSDSQLHGTDNYVKKIKYVSVDKNILSDIFSFTIQNKQNIYEEIKISNFPINAVESATVKLKPSRSIVDENTLWLAENINGTKNMPAPSFCSFYGKIDGQPDSRVYINYSEGEIFSLIVAQNGEQNSIVPYSDLSDINCHQITSVKYHLNELDQSFKYCGTEDFIPGNPELPNQKIGKDEIQKTSLIIAPVAVEGEYFFYELMGKNYNKAALYILNVMALASRIYEEDLNISFYLPYIYIYEDSLSCPYSKSNGKTLTAKLMLMPSVWKNKTVTRANAVLFANLDKQPGGNKVAGIANLGGLCNKSYGFCVLGIKGVYKYPTTNYTWDINVATHEIGHNFGSPHTHACYWNPPLDTCVTRTQPFEIGDACITNGEMKPIQGTIMSYCHLSNSTHSVLLTFHPRCKFLIRKTADAASCIQVPSNPIIKLLNPLGEKTYKAGDTEPIRWTSNNVNQISLKYTSNLGKSWNTIISGINAKDSIYNWKLPDIDSDSMLVLVYDIANPLVADTSIIAFRIYIPKIEIFNPRQGDKFGQTETVEIVWNKTLVDSVTIEFSTDGGNTWEVLAKDLNGQSYMWKVPSIINTNCKIKIYDQKNKNIISETGLFAIGKEKITLLSPVGGEQWCIGQTYQIRWESEYINKIWLWYSGNNGETWSYIIPTVVDANAGIYNWKIQKKASSNALIKISLPADRENPIAMSNSVFKIDSCSISEIVESESHNTKVFGIIEIAPNPAQDDVNLVIYNQYHASKDINISIYNTLGSLVKTINYASSLKPGINHLPFQISNFINGSYFIIVKSGELFDSHPLYILK